MVSAYATARPETTKFRFECRLIQLRRRTRPSGRVLPASLLSYASLPAAVVAVRAIRAMAARHVVGRERFGVDRSAPVVVAVGVFVRRGAAAAHACEGECGEQQRDGANPPHSASCMIRSLSLAQKPIANSAWFGSTRIADRSFLIDQARAECDGLFADASTSSTRKYGSQVGWTSGGACMMPARRTLGSRNTR